MKWILVLVVIKGYPNYYVDSYITDKPFDTMIECFQTRELLLAEVGSETEYFPPRMQAICIRTD